MWLSNNEISATNAFLPKDFSHSLSLYDLKRRVGISVLQAVNQPVSFLPVECPSPFLHYGSVAPLNASHQLYDTVNLTCLPGYYINGPTNATCLSNGNWSHLPVCVGKKESEIEVARMMTFLQFQQ